MVIKTALISGTPLTPEQIKRLDALKNYPIVYDEDCPEMTDEQLRQFKRVNPLPDAAESAQKFG